jgi:hypothetical protein
VFRVPFTISHGIRNTQHEIRNTKYGYSITEV